MFAENFTFRRHRVHSPCIYFFQESEFLQNTLSNVSTVEYEPRDFRERIFRTTVFAGAIFHARSNIKRACND